MNYRILIWKLDKRKGEAVAVVTGKLIVGLILSGEVTILEGRMRGRRERKRERGEKWGESFSHCFSCICAHAGDGWGGGEGEREFIFTAFLAHVLVQAIST